MSNARPPGAPRRKPACWAQAAREILTNEDIRWLDPDLAIIQLVRSIPAVEWEIKRLDAERLYRRLRDSGIGSVEAQHLVAARVGVTDRTLRGWGLNG